MKMRIVYLFWISLALVFAGGVLSLAQVAASARNATAEEITGKWQLLPLPDSVEPKILKNNPWPAACQWYSYSSSGALKSIDKTNSPCEAMSSAEFDKVLPHVASVVSWKYDLSPVYQKALIIVSRTDVPHYAEYWEPQIVTKAFSRDGVDFREGDLILYLHNLNTHKMVWIRHLRRLK
ncbi:hypothetical protein EDE15_4549 [Edaphobacter aggregans]|uniref:Lipocalin-like protein n=1 Tax=Edaphobacter aggregans TaxID=570835 RepID=A0A428MPY7_9BACT|nr:hypothetical protein [Edaphobacter aggregans]RSL18939.1 hypothetical protein EDE15_4549 [Edaphobacter aggregans]